MSDDDELEKKRHDYAGQIATTLLTTFGLSDGLKVLGKVHELLNENIEQRLERTNEEQKSLLNNQQELASYLKNMQYLQGKSPARTGGKGWG